jgi:hypothetical protein
MTPEEFHRQLLEMQHSLRDAQQTMPLVQFPHDLPGITSNIPNGLGGGQDSIVVGVGIWRYDDGALDGLFGANIGVGDPMQNVAANIGLHFSDLSPFGKRGALNLHLHRRVSRSLSIAGGWEEAVHWGATDSPGPSLYLVATKLFTNYRLEDIHRPFNRIMLTAGIGDGRFRSETDIESGNNAYNFFGGLAVNVSKNANLFTEWNGRALNLGANFPVAEKVYLTPLVIDITSGTTVGTRLALGVSYRVR